MIDSGGTYIVAEIGSNYDGELHTAIKYIHACKEAGADAVKFQTLSRETLIAPRVLSGGQWIEHPGYGGFSSLCLPAEWHYELKKASDEAGIEFFSTPFFLEAVSLLEKVGVSTYKIASGDITFFPLLERVGQTGKRVIMSTGGSSIADVEKALGVLRVAGAGEIILLHCVSNYPPEWDEMNVSAVATLKNTFGLRVGLSDHTPGKVLPIAAVALGATLIEKHVTFDRSLTGPDHPFAMTIPEFGDMVRAVRLLERALGSGEKVPTTSEQAKQHRMRRGVYDPGTFEPRDGTGGIWLRPTAVEF